MWELRYTQLHLNESPYADVVAVKSLPFGGLENGVFPRALLASLSDQCVTYTECPRIYQTDKFSLGQASNFIIGQ